MIKYVKFGKKNCHACEVQDKIIEQVKGSFSDKVTFSALKAEDDIDQFIENEVMSVPVSIFYDENGKILDRHNGVLKKVDLEAKLNDLVSKFS